MDGRFPFSPDHRLRTRKQFDRVFQQGRRRGRPLLVVFFLPRDEEEGSPARLGMAVSRKVGKAVVRNRVRRRLREIFRLHQHDFRAPGDVVVVARPSAATATYRELESDLLSALRRLEALKDA